jgi:hypothetical protein
MVMDISGAGLLYADTWTDHRRIHGHASVFVCVSAFSTRRCRKHLVCQSSVYIGMINAASQAGYLPGLIADIQEGRSQSGICTKDSDTAPISKGRC